ncbi:hypothetical protein ACFSHQ_27915 [Gemmobacter lanyuensis]
MKPEAANRPPYFAIDPDAALAALGTPSATADFGEIARACEAGRIDLAGRGSMPRDSGNCGCSRPGKSHAI